MRSNRICAVRVDPSHLDEYENAVKETLQNVALIRQLSIDNSRQQSNCNRLEEVVHRRIELMGAIH